MKRLFILLITCFCIVNVHAAYLRNIPMTLTQPDGTILQCFASGDEFFNYLHDSNGYTIIQHPRTGYFVYAENRNGQLVATEFIAGVQDPASKGLQPYALISPEEWMARRKAWEVPDVRPQNRDFTPNHGTLNNISIFIRFSDDEELTNTYSSIDNMFNDVSEGAVSMRSYFRAASYGAIEIPTTFYPGHNGESIISYQDIYPRSYYQPYNESTNPNGYQEDDRTEREFALLERAVNYINQNYPVPTGLNIDYDSDGNVDNVCFIVKGSVGAWGVLLWPHKWSLYGKEVYINGKRVWTFNFQLADAAGYFTTSTMCHEMNHSLGAPDLYHYYNGTNVSPVGSWDLMENNATPPQHCGAYMKMKYGHWIDEIPEITQAGTYILNPISSPTPTKIAYKIATEYPNQFYILEYRDNTSLFETALPGSGLLVYRINTSFNGNAGYDPSNGVYDEVYLFRPNGTLTDNGNLGSAHFGSDVGRMEFNSSTNPYPFFTDGTPDDNLNIYNITNAGNSISFTYGTSSVCVAPTNLVASVEGDNVSLSWDAATNAASYNIYRNRVLIGNTSGTTFTDTDMVYGGYAYSLKSVDAAGLTSAFSETITVTIVPEGSILIGGGSSATDDYLPSYSYYKYALTQQIYTAQELGESGAITRIAFFNGGAEKTRTYDFYLKATEKSSFSGSDDWIAVSAIDKVFSGTVTLVANDWTFITLSTPFFYDGTSNVVLVADDNSNEWSGSPHMSCGVFEAPSQAIRIYSDGTNYDPFNTSTYSGTVVSMKNQLLLTKVNPSTETLHVTVSAEPVQGGTVSGGGEFNFGETCTVIATVNSGYHFIGWMENGEVVSTDLEFSFTVVQDRNLVATFVEGNQIGDGETINNFLPSYSYYNYTLSQQIYTAEEFGNAGVITSIAFYNGGTEKTRTYDFYMKSTAKTAFSGTTDWEVVTEADKVFSGSVTMVANDWTVITFSNPFIYDGTSNVVLVTDDNTGTYSNGMQCRVFDASGQAIRIYSDGTNYNPFAPTNYVGTVMNLKNQIRFTKEALGECMRPTQLTVTQVGPNFVKLSWNENGASEQWYVTYNGTSVLADTHEDFLLEGLEPETQYTITVRPACNENLFSNPITITTLDACPTPQEVEVSNITGNKATVNWTGYSDNYNVQLGFINVQLYESQNFDNEIPANWNTPEPYPWTIVNGHIQSSNAGIANSQSSISVTVTFTYAGTVEFDAECKGEGSTTYWDHCDFYIDNTRELYVGANVSGWNHYSFDVTAGEHTFTWSYTKDNSVNPTGDYFAVDNVMMGTSEIIWAEPVSVVNAPHTFTGLTPITSYCVKVQGVCGDTETEWSDLVFFTTTESTTLTQTNELAQGWNWWSTYLDITLDDLKTALVEALPGTAITVKSRTQNTAYNPNTNRWMGTLNTLDVTQMYMIYVSSGCEIMLEGMPIAPTEHPVTINNGTNWIAFPLNESMAISEAFAGFAVNGDKVKSRNNNTQYIGGSWRGLLTTFVPGQGYMYISNSQEIRTFTFPISTK